MMDGAGLFIMSLPVWEEWIEIGLILVNGSIAIVSSRMGRVD